MSDHRPQKKLVFGCSGSGKSTKLHELIQAPGYEHRYIYDWDGKISRELGWPAATDIPGLCQLQDSRRPVVFYPEAMFTDLEEGFGFFCRFVLEQAKRYRGKKLIAGDEAQTYTTTNYARFQPAFKHLLNYGRNYQIDVVLAAQRIDELSKTVTGQLTEIFVFKHADTDEEAFAELSKLGISPDAVRALPHPLYHGKVGYIYRHCLTGQMQKVIHEINGKRKAGCR